MANSTGAGLAHIVRTHEKARGIVIKEAAVTGLQLVAQRPDQQDVIISCMCTGPRARSRQSCIQVKGKHLQRARAIERVAHVFPWSS